MKQDLEQEVAQVVLDVLGVDTPVELTRPEEKFGDYATNVALRLSKQLGRSPREIAEELAAGLREELAGSTGQVSEVTIAGPGFINLRLSDGVLGTEVGRILEQGSAYGNSDVYKNQTIVAEYSDPNPFKVLHAGHLYTSIVGDAIANLFQAAGGKVHRVNFGGDVGLHVGKTMWAILFYATQGSMDEEAALFEVLKMKDAPLPTRATYMASRYTQGTDAYEDDQSAKARIVELNRRIYQLHADDDHDSPLAQIYWTCRDWSYDYFKDFYARIGSNFEKYYPESSVSELGLRTVRENTGKVFEESDGAIVFRGEQYGLHTRVFINSKGIPTYEAKDVGLSMQKWVDYHFDKSIIITGNEQLQYMSVVLKAIEQFAPELSQKTVHLTHGLVKLAGGVKMSSRKGNILRAVDVLDVAADANKAATGKDDETVTLGAVKYAMLKQRMGGDIIYDPEESVSLQGNSGPYLQYAHARARSILAKASDDTYALRHSYSFDEWERTLVRKLTEYPETVDQAVAELMPHHICTYLYELAQTFNRFYENTRVIGEAQERERLALVSAYAGILKDGLGLLGITAPESM